MRKTKAKRFTRRCKLTYFEDKPTDAVVTFGSYKRFLKKERTGQDVYDGNTLYFDKKGKLCGFTLINIHQDAKSANPEKK